MNTSINIQISTSDGTGTLIFAGNGPTQSIQLALAKSLAALHGVTPSNAHYGGYFYGIDIEDGEDENTGHAEPWENRN